MPTTSLADRACHVDALREKEFPYLDAEDHAYLDYTGAALPPLSLVRGGAARLASGVYGNPHTASPASLASTRLVEEARRAALSFCRASPEDYVAVFTPNATAALRLVAEAYPFGPDAPLAFLGDDHNSVLGMRRYAVRAGAPVRVVPLGPGFRTRTEAVTVCLDAGGRGCSRSRRSRTRRAYGIRWSGPVRLGAGGGGWRWTPPRTCRPGRST
ncbi:aminotransferase class V-fold PLP-dependent enzyme [Streptomyces sp. LBUM 1476]|nr:aminotransferase class V-fold PLP-dependent enzyme [Streptomyces sp. LBUM 1476]